tara:strand:+ start:16 stop:654 length:639 start_codon:yes stop_codon:yes gene_type:complete
MISNILTNLFNLNMVDTLLCKILGQKARWFQLHAVTNAYIVYQTKDNLYNLLIAPIHTMGQGVDRTPILLIISLHVYHMIFFHLTYMDYIHHISSVFLGGVPALLYGYNKTLNGVSFFVCGLPGCIDYICLTAVKHNRMLKITEKKINSYLNSYIRMPGILYCVFLNMMAVSYELDPYTPIWISRYLSVLFCWNAIYFNYLSIYNYGVHDNK